MILAAKALPVAYTVLPFVDKVTVPVYPPAKVPVLPAPTSSGKSILIKSLILIALSKEN